MAKWVKDPALPLQWLGLLLWLRFDPGLGTSACWHPQPGKEKKRKDGIDLELLSCFLLI